ncbi:MAG: hypothetical protein AAB901_02115, partial [Patescibacteria group bacterium]
MRVSVLLSTLTCASLLAFAPAFAGDTSITDAVQLQLAEAVLPKSDPSPPEYPGGNQERVPAQTAYDPSTTFTVELGVDSGRVFLDQGLTLTQRPVGIADFTLCKEGWCFDFWRAQPFTNHPEDRETDLQVWKDLQHGSVNYQIKGAFYEVEGREIWEAKFTASHSVSSSCTISASAEFMRGGFNDNIAHGEVGCAHPLADKVKIDGTVGAFAVVKVGDRGF